MANSVEVNPLAEAGGKPADVEYAEVEARSLSPALRARILDLRNRCFPEFLGTVVGAGDYWDWKFRGRQSSLWCAHVTGRDELLGFYSCLALDYLSPVGALRVGLVVDVMTAPEARGRGIFTALGAVATNDMLGRRSYDLLAGYPIRPAVLPGHRKVGWSFCEQLPVYAAPALRPLGWILRLWSRRSGFTVEPANPGALSSVTGWEAFRSEWEARAAADGLTFLRTDEAFNRWRYSAPSLNYQALIARDRAGCVAGYVTYRGVALKGIPSLAIADVKVLDPAAFVPLVATMMTQAPRTTLLIAGMFSGAAARTIRPLASVMLKLPLRFQLILKGRGRGLAAIEQCGMLGCYLTWVDTDDV